MFRRSKLSLLNTKDDRIKIINDRINVTEIHLMDMYGAFSNCTIKLAKYRDSFDELAKSMKHYSDEEEINQTFSQGLINLTNAVTIVADYMDLYVHRLQAKILNELSHFDELCKKTRDNIRRAVIARDKEVLKQRQMYELASKFPVNNSAADSELLKAKMEVNRTNNEINDIINKFEKSKLSDMKNILNDFILINMKYHTKVLEALTASYYDVNNIDEHADFLEFEKIMKSHTDVSDKKSNKKNSSLRSSQSMDSLDRDQLLSPLRGKGRLSQSNKNLHEAKSQEEDDNDREEEIDDEDDDDEEDDEEYDSDNSKSDDETNTEADEVEEAMAIDSASEQKANQTAQFKFKKPLAKPQVKHPFKAVAATHVLKKSSKEGKNVFVTKRLTTSGTSGISASRTGIPRMVTKHDDNKKHLSSTKADSVAGIKKRNADAHAGGGGEQRRLVTVFESKKKSTIEKDMGNVIDCTRNDTK